MRIVLGLTYFLLLTQACLTEAKLPVSVGSGDATVVDGNAALGLTLYEQKCSNCHQPIATSAKAGASYSAILNSGSLGFHGSVNPWPTAEECADIAAALAPKGDASAGLAIYNQLCSNCHQPIGSSNKLGSSSQTLINAASHPAHSMVSPWPDATGCLDLAAALEGP